MQRQIKGERYYDNWSSAELSYSILIFFQNFPKKKSLTNMTGVNTSLICVFYLLFLQYGLICPSVVCLPMANDCALVEYIVLEYDVYVDGRSVKIRCQSCPYCLDDWPLGRKRRSVYDLLGWSSSSCASLTCPSVSDTCNDVRSTDVLLRDTRCRTCPACYDSTVLRHPH